MFIDKSSMSIYDGHQAGAGVADRDNVEFDFIHGNYVPI